MLHDRAIVGHVLYDIKSDCNANHFGVPQRVNDMKMYETYEYHPSHHQIIQHTVPPPSPPPVDGEVLDLSRRCDSVETRKTPSPYNSPSSLDTTSPSTPCESPPNSGLRKTPTLVPTPVSVITSPLMLNEITSSVPRLYPFYHSNVKQEVITTPSSGAVPVNSSMVPYYSQSPHIMVPEPYYEPSSPPKYNNTSLEDHSKLNSPPPFQNENSKALYPNIINIATTGSANSIKATRPFNAYPRDPLLVAAHFAASDTLFEKASFERYTSYRKRALDNIHNTNGGPRVVTNPKMRRTNHRTSVNSEGEERSVESSDNDSCTGNSSSTEQTPKPTPSTTPAGNGTYTTSPRTTNNSGIVKDEAYYERRRKNNEAAKKSRDRRRIKEDEIAIRAAYLERQNIELLCQIDALKKQLKEISGNSASKDFQYSADRTTKS